MVSDDVLPEEIDRGLLSFRLLLAAIGCLAVTGMAYFAMVRTPLGQRFDNAALIGAFERIDHIVETLGIRLKRMKCAAMEGLVEEGKEVIDAIEAGPLRDAALIGGAQKVEHYEIASYGTLSAIAKQLGYTDAVTLLQATLKEEKATDDKLTMLAEQAGNQRAAQKSAA